MAHGLNHQNVIAVVWDFDNTLIPGSMQQVIFEAYGINEKDFWTEVDSLPNFYKKNYGVRMSNEFAYLNRFLAYVENGIFKDLTNRKLREFGQKIRFYPGLPRFFSLLKETIEKDPLFSEYDIKLEHYIVSTGFYETILGSAIAPYVEGIWACQYLENPAPPHIKEEKSVEQSSAIKRIAYVVDQTTKTRAIYEINKGCNKNPNIDVNSLVAEKDRRIPFTNMIYIADGPSDIPVFSLLKKYGGRAYAVYDTSSNKQFEQVDQLLTDGRISAYGPSDYREGSQTTMWLMTHTKQIAKAIAARIEEELNRSIHNPPGHIKE